MSHLRRLERLDVPILLVPIVIVAAVLWSALAPRTLSVDGRARALESEIRCPVCQGLSIADSPALLAQQMRSAVKAQLGGGASDDSVRRWFVDRYGQWILLTPDASGPGALLWLAPALIVASGAAGVAMRGRAQRGGARMPGGPGPLPERRFGRRGALLAAAAMAIAIVAPIAIAVGPRSGGQEFSGRSAAQSNPSVAELESRLQSDPQDVATLTAVGDTYLAGGRSGDAIGMYERALAIDSNSVPALLQVGNILLSAGRPADAGPVFDRVLLLKPTQPDALLLRAVARIQLDGRLDDQARMDLERFLAVAPADPRHALAEQILASGAPSTAP